MIVKYRISRDTILRSLFYFINKFKLSQILTNNPICKIIFAMVEVKIFYFISIAIFDALMFIILPLKNYMLSLINKQTQNMLIFPNKY